MSYIFLHVVEEGGTLKVRPYPNQEFDNGDPVKQFNVACNKEIRGIIGEGGSLAVDSDGLRQSGIAGTGNFYKASHVYHFAGSNFLDKTDCSVASVPCTEALNKFLASQGVSARMKVKKGSYLEKMMDKASFNPPTIDNDGFYVPKELWYYLLRNARENVPTLLVGETGTGKTELAKMLANAVNKKLRKIDMGTITDPQMGLIGTHKFKGGESLIELAPFIEYIQQPSFMLLDEVNRAPLGTSNILLPVLDGGREIAVEISEDSRVVPVNEDCIFFATANIGVRYSATKTIDRALRDRFRVAELEQLSPDIEAKIYQKRTHIDVAPSEIIANLIDNLREEYNQGKISDTVSIRYGLDICSLYNDGYDIRTAFELVVLNLFDKEGGQNSEREVVRKIINSK